MRLIIAFSLLISAIGIAIFGIMEVNAEARRRCWSLDSDEAIYVSCRK